jgi:hypothetical protein
MPNRIRTLALAVVAIGGAALAGPRPAHAMYVPPLANMMYCCCESSYNICTNRCCSPNGCRVTPNGCLTLRAQ